MKIELTIATTYVPKWGAWEGAREVIQNALDARDEGGTLEISYKPNKLDPSTGTIRIVNTGKRLDRATMLLGATSKTGTDARGQFGEGYKLAWLALVRAGVGVTVRTGDEVWKPRIGPSSQFNGADVLIVETFPLQRKQPIEGVEVELEGFGQSDWRLCQERVMELAKPTPEESAAVYGYGALLMGERFKGKLYSKGLYVCQLPKEFAYGYDLQRVELDRDRRLAEPWSLRYQVSSLLGTAMQTGALSPERVYELLNSETGEARAVQDFATYLPREAAQRIAELFQARHGASAVPVESIGEGLDVENVGLAPVVVKSAAKAVIERTLGTFETRKVEAGFDIVRRLSPQDLLESERRALASAIDLVGSVPELAWATADHIVIAEFRSDAILGRYCAGDNVSIAIAAKVLANPAELLATLVHEACHAEVGADGQAHQNLVERRLAQIAMNLYL